MEAQLFQRFCDIAYDRAGVRLKAGKESLVSARVAKRLRALRIDTPRQYLSYLEDDRSGEEIVQFLDVITTNFTSFFREPDHFELVHEVTKEAVAQGQRRFRFWSAASSSGEEPYTMAITLLEAFEGRDVDAKILATDISTRVLSKAQEGVYDATALKPLSKHLRTKYFSREIPKHRLRNGASEVFRIKPMARSLILFRRLNLSTPPFPMTGPMDMVLCRNVMIYFDNYVRQRLISEVERLLKPGGFLMIGHTETLTAVRTELRAVRPSVYRKPS